jgi:hypothetical protein
MSVILHSDVLHVNLSGVRSKSYKYRDFVAMLPMARANGWLPVALSDNPFVREVVGDYSFAPPRPPMIVRVHTGSSVKVPGDAFLCTLDVHFVGGSIADGIEIAWVVTCEDRPSGSVLKEPFVFDLPPTSGGLPVSGVSMFMEYTERKSGFMFVTHIDGYVVGHDFSVGPGARLIEISATFVPQLSSAPMVYSICSS